LFNSSFKISVAELLGILAEFLNCLPGVGIEALKVIELKLLVVQLLPEDRVEVEGDVGGGTESRTHEKSEEVEHTLVSRVLGQRVKVEALTAVSMVKSVVGCLD
jgi:hypothetical protein